MQNNIRIYQESGYTLMLHKYCKDIHYYDIQSFRGDEVAICSIQWRTQGGGARRGDCHTRMLDQSVKKYCIFDKSFSLPIVLSPPKNVPPKILNCLPLAQYMQIIKKSTFGRKNFTIPTTIRSDRVNWLASMTWLKNWLANWMINQLIKLIDWLNDFKNLAD